MITFPSSLLWLASISFCLLATSPATANSTQDLSFSLFPKKVETLKRDFSPFKAKRVGFQNNLFVLAREQNEWQNFELWRSSGVAFTASFLLENRSSGDGVEEPRSLWRELGLPAEFQALQAKIDEISSSQPVYSSDRQAVENNQRQIAAEASLLEGNWSLDAEEPSLIDDQIWQLRDAQYLERARETDYIIGSQRTFWSNSDNYWGFTAIKRWGIALSESERHPQATRTQENGWQEQLPSGASALTISGGKERENSQSSFESQQDFQGGVGFRHGISDALTVGASFASQESLLGSGEILVDAAPLQIKLSATENFDSEAVALRSQFRLPSLTLDFDYDTDLELGKGQLNWQAFPGFLISATGNSLGDLTTKVRYTYDNPDFSTLIEAGLDSDSNLQWRLDSRWGHFDLSSQVRKFDFQSELSFWFLENEDWGHSLYFDYQTHQHNYGEDELTTFGWRYRSPTEKNRQSPFELELGYVLGSSGSGLTTSAAATIFQDLKLRGSYWTISPSSDEPSFKLELISK